MKQSLIDGHGYMVPLDDVLAEIAAAVKREREEIAVIIEKWVRDPNDLRIAMRLVEDIRARGKPPEPKPLEKAVGGYTEIKWVEKFNALIDRVEWLTKEHGAMGDAVNELRARK